ncbi:MAG: type II toxin-antitoxin system RelE/ParE family toxin [Saprospiraceae bacterium]|nr:type II toxin-antitoxin system RelE/ParE family toxin [Saprospiraceae bacterium]
MIKSFADRETEKIWKGTKSKVLPPEIQQVARRKLRMINNAESINDLRIPPANRLKKLQGELLDFYSIRINDQWRIIFNWEINNAEEVQITDYHE